MHFLLTNDDGYDAGGLAALKAAVEPFGKVTVAAPRRSHSGKSHAVTYNEAIAVELTDHAGLGPVHVCDGSPADCVRLALTKLVSEPVDWVLAGINRGANLGVDVFYSGTVAAAREASIMGCGAVSFSQYVRRDVEVDWDRAQAWVSGLLPQFVRLDNHQGTIWNVNFPLSTTVSPAVRVVPLACDPLPMDFDAVEGEAAGVTRYLYSGDYSSRSAGPDTDVAVAFASDIAVTPIWQNATKSSLLDVSFDAP